MKLKEFLRHTANHNELVIEEKENIIAQGCPAELELSLPESRLNQQVGLIWGLRTVQTVYGKFQKTAIVVTIIPKQ